MPEKKDFLLCILFVIKTMSAMQRIRLHSVTNSDKLVTNSIIIFMYIYVVIYIYIILLTYKTSFKVHENPLGRDPSTSCARDYYY